MQKVCGLKIFQGEQCRSRFCIPPKEEWRLKQQPRQKKISSLNIDDFKCDLQKFNIRLFPENVKITMDFVFTGIAKLRLPCER